MMRWAEITVEVPSASVEPVSAALNGIGCAGVAVVDPRAPSSDPFADWTAEEQLARAKMPDRCRVTAYLPVDDRIEAALDTLQERLTTLEELGFDSGRGILLRTVEDDCWADAWKQYFKPLRVGRRFVVKPTWSAWEASPGDRIIEIDPGMAFGSGTHPTTRLCLQLLEEEEPQLDGARVLDWGTGSGILALGAALLRATEVVAVDLDPTAVRTAQENADRNGLSGRIHPAVGSIAAVPADPQFDLVVANIVADPIIDGASEIVAHLRPGGRAIVSGIIDQREAEVIAALEAAGLSLLSTLEEEEWRALHLRR
jgi:ribosomal protein L11 methyltransferase